MLLLSCYFLVLMPAHNDIQDWPAATLAITPRYARQLIHNALNACTVYKNIMYQAPVEGEWTRDS